MASTRRPTLFSRFRARLCVHFDENRRAFDERFLWPALRQNAVSLDEARAAFGLHASMDPAWRRLDPNERARRIAELS